LQQVYFLEGQLEALNLGAFEPVDRAQRLERASSSSSREIEILPPAPEVILAIS